MCLHGLNCVGSWKIKCINLSSSERRYHSMKKVLSVIAAAAMLLSLTACKGKDTSSGAADLKTLRVGADVVYPPFEYFDTDGTTPIGIDTTAIHISPKRLPITAFTLPNQPRRYLNSSSNGNAII